ncbi:MAG: hypothetical protein IJG68_06675 [Bacilli bacterium]|nr:hypothetical protein [Bacilli bacterium]
MEKINFGKSTATISENMNRKKIYVDPNHGDVLTTNILKRLDSLEKSYMELGSLLNKMSYKNCFKDDSRIYTLQCAKKCSSLSSDAKNLKQEWDYQYHEDIKMMLIERLDERITYLESKLLSNKN